MLEGNTRAGRITSAMFGSAMEAAMAAARQVHVLPTPCFILTQARGHFDHHGLPDFMPDPFHPLLVAYMRIAAQPCASKPGGLVGQQQSSQAASS